MKKNIIILFAFLCFNTWNAQAQIEDTDLEEMVIDKLSRAGIIDIIKKVRNQMYNNYSYDNYQYFVSHQAAMNDSTELLKSALMYDVSINLKNKKINKSVLNHPKNVVSMDTVFFDRYSGNDSPMYWLTEVVIRKYVNIPELDFFNNFKDYSFSRSRTKSGDYIIEFYSEQFYEGFFQYDTNFNLKRLEFTLIKPYVIDHSQSKNGKFMFEKNWIYTKEKVAITVKTNAEGKNYVDELKATEEIKDYNFTRFDSQGGVVIKDIDLDFKSDLIFKKM
ncbi:hypothetical protein MG290_03550 [Flavobacterium sp. CBA20B-1]|uniref:hypothetical protein n=1 Tax=unclassified Flavobacterium TaxID=196869 RepID=UPI0022247F14|nr:MULTISPECIES: hypothetical protein [unclassified Flavobacterium]WCM42768.1 hypothetical protein MG290_03550 [Flavobacterium sp. CBA20B-1]